MMHRREMPRTRLRTRIAYADSEGGMDPTLLTNRSQPPCFPECDVSIITTLLIRDKPVSWIKSGGLCPGPICFVSSIPSNGLLLIVIVVQYRPSCSLPTNHQDQYTSPASKMSGVQSFHPPRAPFHKKDTLMEALQGGASMGVMGFAVSAMKNHLEKHNKGAMGVFTRTGSLIGWGGTLHLPESKPWNG
ncbi:hypothetical protein G7K_2448-t1 [Saitoella complicata NRRL Y-17804]|uniref:Uncharacterized protein n=1 Tax=Saitoella complicata (strain BCRC 22490 / CBS 7301 / JCM 7358 / NBRC 10748 / NRRL Y-17804) TaxID=698492 RepID=A0A0E9NEJ7_SAICN|nr:hypothetical protein G7K_2448-t1 [Saitoella complicata NRRL Y-17804]